MRFEILGSFRVSNAAGGEIEIETPKQRAVLALLVINGGSVLSVDRIVDELWGDAAPATAHATLQAYISNLRRTLEPDRPPRTPSTVILSTPPGYRLAVSRSDVDAFVFEDRAAAGRSMAGKDVGGQLIGGDPGEAVRLFTAALDLWRGPALADFMYEPFAASEIARLEELRVTTVEDRAAVELARGASATLVAELERLVTEHPLRERAWRHLMLALYRSGRQAEALRAYRRYATVLGDEAGLTPSSELQDLEQAMLDQAPELDLPRASHAVLADRRTLAPTGAGASSGETAPEASPGDATTSADRPLDAPTGEEEGDAARSAAMLIGRTEELAAFDRALDRATAGTGGVVLVEGEAGIGKSRLLEAMQSHARRRGALAALARCVEVGGTPPFWPWAQVLRGLDEVLGAGVLGAAAAPHLRDLAPLLPRTEEGTGLPDSLDPGPHRVAGALMGLLGVLSRNGPIVMFIDDLYGADPDSLAVLTLLAAEIATGTRQGLGVVVVGSFRSTDLPADHPLGHTVAQLTRLDRVMRLPLRRFGVGEVAEVIRMVAGVELAPDAVEAIHARTEGNAFFTVELTRLWSAEGTLGAAAHLSEVPGSVRDVLRRRLAQLDEATVALLRVAAVCGRQWDLDVVVDVVGTALDTALDEVDAAVAAGLVIEDDRPGRFRFSHVLVGDTIAHGLGALRRAQIHRDLALALEKRTVDDPRHWVDIAHHAVEAVPITGAAVALPSLARAGQHALASNAIQLAEQLLERRLDLVMTLPRSTERDEMEIEALLDLSTVLIWLEGYHSERLLTASDRVLALAGDGIDRLAEAVLPSFTTRFSNEIVSGRATEADATAAALEELSIAHPFAMLAACAHIGTLTAAVHVGRIDEALRRIPAGETLITRLDPDDSGSVMMPPGHQSLTVSHCVFSGWALILAGDEEAAREAFARAHRVTDRSRHPFTRAFCASVEVLVAGMAGDPRWAAESLAWARTVEGIAEYGLSAVWFEIAEAWISGRGHDPAAGAARMRELIHQLEAIGAGVAVTLYWSEAAELHLASGDAAAALEAADLGIERALRHGERFWQPELERQRAVALAAAGKDAEAAEALDRARGVGHEFPGKLLLDRIAAMG